MCDRREEVEGKGEPSEERREERVEESERDRKWRKKWAEQVSPSSSQATRARRVAQVVSCTRQSSSWPRREKTAAAAWESVTSRAARRYTEESWRSMRQRLD